MSERAVLGVYALIAALFIIVFPNFAAPNEFTRWALVASVVEYGSLEVSRAIPLLGPGFEDLAMTPAGQYSNKAPGVALVSSAGYLAARPIAGAPSRDNLRAVMTAMRWCGATLPLLAAAWLFARVARERGAESVPFAVAALLFATPLFTYGLLLFSHALVAAALFGAWVLLYLRDRGGFAAGALIGIAVASEYPMAAAGAVLVIGMAVTRQWKRLALVVAGGLPLAMLLAAYHDAAFGGPFVAPYAFEKLPEYREVAHSGLFGLRLPSLPIIAKLLFHPARGLLLFSPILIACMAAFPRVRRLLPAPAFATLVTAPLAIFLMYAGYPNWHGGWNVGPRYLTAMLPFVVFPLAFVAPRWWTAAFFGASATAVMLTTLVFPYVPLDFPLPWGSLALPLLGEGLVAPNLLHLIARPLAIAMVPLAIGAAMFAGVPRRLVASALAGAAITLVAGFVAWQATAHQPRPLIIRTYFADVYFGRAGAIDELLRRRIASPVLRERRAGELGDGPTAWPF